MAERQRHHWTNSPKRSAATHLMSKALNTTEG